MISPEILRRFSMFAGLDEEDIKNLAMEAEEVRLPANQSLFTERDDADALYLIIKGEIELQLALDQERKSRTNLTTVVTGEMVGWSALVDPYIYTMSAVALTDVRLVKFDAQRLRDMLEENPRLGYAFSNRVMKALSTRLTNLRVRFASLIDEQNTR